MKVLIIEDEYHSAQRAKSLLLEYDQNINVVDTVDSVEKATNWLVKHQEPDLLLVDIHLADGSSFDIFKKIPVKNPVIFTTAYDQYAIQAFKINSIDYLLKPLDFEDLSQALNKYHQLNYDRKSIDSLDIQRIIQSIETNQKKYKSRFLVKFGDTLQYKTLDEIAYFFADDKIVYLVCHDAKRYIIDYTLEQLEQLLQPDFFFRLNRKVITKIASIATVKAVYNGRLLVKLKPNFESEIYVSKERCSEFKTWLDQ
ncbi:LytR/AlgR family response regulator transcription factor [Flectobacillus roseus]|uniref:LytTR family DNA-binding domain-containing protein n=1 Tax=Flectobacillus roseus TaxID=502259 RepID=A0ABT6YBD1_9BACT|nr:LytTR family DNA-binding domain-containing protein [Flectobacillus roseus]MDI9860754.1 LytTR family DNA-binding domain-containing protein [Flectobacillus roseus]MDI9869158.1 LytTR family DNA-binding domain-containing protein [Flectobacillus roseus]NBA77677.1 response regulator [Emticicia sp. ODNR4P]